MKAYIQRTQQDEGFTLIELLIVIVVIGVLAGIVLFGTAQFTSDSEDACDEANVRVIESATQAYKAKTGSAPAGDTPAEVRATLEGAGYLVANSADCTA